MCAYTYYFPLPKQNNSSIITQLGISFIRCSLHAHRSHFGIYFSSSSLVLCSPKQGKGSPLLSFPIPHSFLGKIQKSDFNSPGLPTCRCPTHFVGRNIRSSFVPRNESCPRQGIASQRITLRKGIPFPQSSILNLKSQILNPCLRLFHLRAIISLIFGLTHPH